MDLMLFLLLFLAVLAIYLPGLSSVVFGGDSGDIILASYFGGVAHPPGYPLNTMIGYLFTHLPLAATVAYKANLQSAVLTAIAIGLVFLITRRLTKNSLVAAAAALTLAFTPLIWLYSHIAEVFQLNLTLVAAAILFLVKWQQEKQIGRLKYLYWSFILWGLAVFHHQTSALLAPAIIYLVYRVDKSLVGNLKVLTRLLGAFLIGALPYLFTVIVAHFDPPINWNDPKNLTNLIRLVTRADYGTFLASKSFIGARAGERLAQILSYFSFVKADFGWLGILLISLGAVYLFIKNRLWFWFLTLAAFFSGPFFVSYASYALVSDFLLSVWERFLMLSYLFLAIFLAFGFYAIWRYAARLKFKRLGSLDVKKLVLPVILLSSLFLPMVMILTNWPKTDLSGYQLGDYLGHDVLASSEPDSLIFLFDDTVVFNTQYKYFTAEEFGDRKIIVGGSLLHAYYRAQVTRDYLELAIPDDFKVKEGESASFMSDLIVANWQRFPIYTYGFTSAVADKAWEARGLLFKLVEADREGEDMVVAEIGNVFSNFKYDPEQADGYTHLAPAHIKSIYASAYNRAGYLLLGKEFYDQAAFYFGKSTKINPNVAEAFLGLSRVYLARDDCDGAQTSLTKAYQVEKHNIEVVEQLIKLARDCLGDENLAKKYEQEREAQILRLAPKFK